jgi:hypothetical protein
MTQTPANLSSDAFRRIDDLACGAGFAPEETVSRSRAFQAALGTRTPLCRTVAEALLAERGGRFDLYTGFVVPGKYPNGENDGPPGTVALARALRRVGLRPEIRVDREVLETVRWLLAELHANAAVRPIGPDVPDAPDVAIAIEKPGANALGVMHTLDGARIEGGSRPVDRAFADLYEAGALTVAIGDQGNEIGFGAIAETVGRINPRAHSCTCGCGGGIASVTPTTLLYPSAVSNWGAYGLVASLALLAGDASILLRPEEERRMLKVCAVRGCCDGVRRHGTYGIDGIDGSISVGLVAALEELVLAELGRANGAPVRGPIESGNEALRG